MSPDHEEPIADEEPADEEMEDLEASDPDAKGGRGLTADNSFQKWINQG